MYKPGLKLDTLIAEKVLKLKICLCNEDKLRQDWMKEQDRIRKDFYSDHGSCGFFRFNSNKDCNFCGLKYVPQLMYSTDIGAAWELVEKLKISIAPPGSVYASGEYGNSDVLWDCEAAKVNKTDWSDSVSAKAETAAHAICLVALKAYGIYGEDNGE